MMCPACCGDSKVIDTRSTTRTRQCKTCGVRWKTHEAVIEGSVVKPGTPKKKNAPGINLRIGMCKKSSSLPTGCSPLDILNQKGNE